MEEKSIVLIECTDKKGLVNKVTSVIFGLGLNIVSNNQFVDEESNHFFMRTEIVGKVSKDILVDKIKENLPDDAMIKVIESKPKRIVIMGTKEHHCFSDIIIRSEYKEINADIVGAIGNYDELRGLAEKFDIPYSFITHNEKTKEEHEDEIIKKIEEYNPDYIVLAKYMRILTPKFVEKYEHKIINIHHSFLPAFIGANPYRQAYNRGVKIIGATAHFVTNDLDDGPIIAQEVLKIDHTYSAKEMRNAGRDAERAAFSKALKLVFEDRVFINKNRTVIFE
ncbi:formyltetrahydrofolate deformylase [Haliovirga abyssi]|uniref:Formyltetrahydrofolate deformylase n=1 Tax=Haliovirga abyssi TaxID=2996794 RepID=A0AAU9DXR3_9FUSO|nr:formyltetrahydrofolate deformylase [Haliovirga abyssi]BDU50180.1 formyltetrahydrofolate deformylase [Haliovirga abyssi]